MIHRSEIKLKSVPERIRIQQIFHISQRITPIALTVAWFYKSVHEYSIRLVWLNTMITK